MNTVLSLMDKIYGDSNTLSMIYIIGAVLLFIFIIMLIFSLRKPKEDKKTKIIEEPNINNNEEIKENVVDLKKEKIEKQDNIQSIDNPVDKEVEIKEPDKKELEEKEDIFKILDKVEEHKEEKQEVQETDEKDLVSNLSSNIPDVDKYVDDVVKKTYEKNEQFSSVYVGNNTSTIKLDKVLNNLNVDDDIREDIVPEEEKTVVKEEVVSDEKVNDSIELTNNATGEKTSNTANSLDALKKSLEDKKKEVNNKQDDLKAKLESLKNNKEETKEVMNAEDLLNKLNSLKNTD